MALDRPSVPNDLSAFWMPFTANRQFKKAPRMLVAAEGMHYTTADGRRYWTAPRASGAAMPVTAGRRIVEAIQAQAAELDYAPAFQMGHPKAFELATRVRDLRPSVQHVFFTNSGSESVDTALKIALAYHRARGEAARTRLIGRERGYHGVGFGGISVGGITNNRRFFGTMLAGVDHLPHTHLPAHAFTRGQPEQGADLADELERLVALHGAETIAAVIVEPVAGSTGVLIPPKGYLERLRAVTAKHGILLIFDEVITGFGRLGAAFAAEHSGYARHDHLRQGADERCRADGRGAGHGGDPRRLHDRARARDRAVPRLYLFGLALASAAGLATLEVYREEGLFERAAELAGDWDEGLHSLRDCRT